MSAVEASREQYRPVTQVLRWLEYRGDQARVYDLLRRFHSWLATEAVTAGGIGPSEADRLWSRHIADSLTFMAGLDAPRLVVDVGAGVGLPGIPLAVALPDTRFTLLDRSQKRCDLADRARRILGLANVEVVQGDANELVLPHDSAVSRAFAATAEITVMLRRLVPKASHAVLGGSHWSTPPAAHNGVEVVTIPDHVLGHAAWLVKVSLST